MGRTPEIKKVTLTNGSGETITKEVETFTWEKLDYVDKVRKHSASPNCLPSP